MVLGHAHTIEWNRFTENRQGGPPATHRWLAVVARWWILSPYYALSGSGPAAVPCDLGLARRRTRGHRPCARRPLGAGFALSCSDMSAERWHRIEALFEHAIELPKAERGDFVDSACDGDAQLLGELRALLADANNAD